MPNQAPTLQDRLKELHSEAIGEGQELKHNSILIVEPDPQVRRVMVRVLGGIFPGFKIEESSPVQAVGKLRGEVKERIAMVVADTSEMVDLMSLVEFLRPDDYDYSPNSPSHAADVPLVLMSAGSPDGQEQTSFEETINGWLTSGKIDGLFEKPFTPEDLASTLHQAINCKLIGAAQCERAARTEVLTNFVVDNQKKIALWIKELRPLSPSQAPQDSEEFDDLDTLVKSLEKMGEVLALISTFSIDDLPKKTLSKYMHDLASPLSAVIAFYDFVLNSPSLTDSEKSTLRIFKSELDNFHKEFLTIRDARRSKSSWQSILLHRNATEVKEQKLEFPKGVAMKVCVVDNEQIVVDVCRRDLSKAGAEVVAAMSLEDINAIKDSDVNLVLLDNDLGEGLKGHTLIQAIRARWPQALIVAHTGDSDEINKDPNNQYKAQGVEVVGKREWTALSGVVRRKLPKEDF